MLIIIMIARSIEKDLTFGSLLARRGDFTDIWTYASLDSGTLDLGR